MSHTSWLFNAADLSLAITADGGVPLAQFAGIDKSGQLYAWGQYPGENPVRIDSRTFISGSLLTNIDGSRVPLVYAHCGSEKSIVRRNVATNDDTNFAPPSNFEVATAVFHELQATRICVCVLFGVQDNKRALYYGAIKPGSQTVDWIWWGECCGPPVILDTR